jgi:hypothetical protein
MNFQIRSPTEGGSRGGANPPRWGCGGNATAYGVRPDRSGRRGPGGSAPGGVRGSAPTKTVYDLKSEVSQRLN